MSGFTISTTLDQPYEATVESVLPCNVVVRALDDDTTVVEAFDPDAMMGLADSDALRTVATDAKERLTAALAALRPVREAG